MPPPKKLLKWFFATLVLYAFLMAPWPGLERGYAYTFRAGGNAVFARFWFWGDGLVRFRDLTSLKAGDLVPGTPSIQAEGIKDTLMELRSRAAPGSIGYLRTSSRYIGYSPTVLVIALILATPIAWSRRGRAAIWGLLLVHGFIALRVSLTLAANGFGADKGYALFHPGPFLRGALSRAEIILSDDPTVTFMVPVLIWFLVAFRPSQWSMGRDSATPDKAKLPS